MVTVWRVKTDPDRYQYLLSDGPDPLEEFPFDGTPLADRWRPPSLHIHEPLLGKPDFWSVFMISGLFAVGAKAFGAVQSILEQSGELLQLPCEEENLLALNVTSVINCLDTQRSEFDPEAPSFIDKYVFHPKRLEPGLFKLPERRKADIFTVTGLEAAQDEFKTIVETKGLRGLRFQKVWSEAE